MLRNFKSAKKSSSSGNSKKSLFRLSPMAGVLLLAASLPVQAVDLGSGVDFSGYTRGGVFSGMPRGGYTLGGDMQKFRLGNEGDNGIELEMKKTFDMGGGQKWSIDYMPTVWNGKVGANQAYGEMTGLDIAPEAKFWAGQRRLRIQDVHIMDYFFMDYGINFGAGMTDYSLGFAKLGVGVFNGGSLDNGNSQENNARRVNVDLSAIQTNPGGSVRILGTVVSGNFQYGKPGSMIGIKHDQTDFLVTGLTNTLFLQTADGHAALNGQFQGLGDASTAVAATATTPASGGQQVGKSSNRIGDTIVWQSGKFGGQALVVVQNGKDQGGVNDGVNTKDITLGGRVSYGITHNFKLLLDGGTTTRTPDNSAKQQLNKLTFAPTLSLGSDFYSRPELRFYVTKANWNAAAAAANAGTAAAPGFGANGRTSATTLGVQMEAWW